MTGDSSASEDRRLTLFFNALEIDDRLERTAYLTAQCVGDPALRHWIEKEIQRQTGAPETEPAPVSLIAEAPPEPELSAEIEAILAALKPEETGDHIGPYKLLEQLGEGGFGVVWHAEQEKPVRREVALKILKLGMDSRQIVSRFEQERQALAVLDHPGVAKIYDAGATLSGRPYFVMELVRGASITEFCNEAKLSIRERLELFLRVCLAVQHAHQKGIIHRDLKPSNILVTRVNDGDATPKVIDLGLAKVTERQSASEYTLAVTQEGQMVGTPLYMSPEQAEGSLDVDTRTDVYALGAILYELLVGRTPFEPSEEQQLSNESIRRAVLEQEPRRPSLALRTLPAHTLEALAEERSCEKAKLIHGVRGDLEWICIRALEKDRRRRYPSVSGLAQDIQRYLTNEPISARPPSQWYRLQKVVSRNRGTVMTSALLLVTILIGAGVSFREAVNARTAQREALDARLQEATQRQAAEAEREVARNNEYASDIGLAQQSLATGNYGRATELLEKHRPKKGQPDFRGFTWRYLWTLVQGDEHVSFGQMAGPSLLGVGNTMAYSPDGHLLAIGGPRNVTIFDTRSHLPVATLPSGAESLAFTPDNLTLITSSRRDLTFWKTGSWLPAQSHPEDAGPFALSADGSTLAIALQDGIELRDVGTWKKGLLLGGATAPLAFSPDAKMLVADGEAGLKIWPLVEGGTPRLLAGSRGIFGTDPPGHHPLQVLSFANGGESVVAVQNALDERGVFLVRMWESKSGLETAVLPDDPSRPEHTGRIPALAVSPDGKTLATASMDHSIRLWDLVRGKRTAILQGHHSEMSAVAFAPDGQTLMSCDRSGAIKQWATHRPPPQAEALNDIQAPLGFSADGRTIAALTSKNTVAFFDLNTKARLRQFELEHTSRPGHPKISMSPGLGILAQVLDGGRIKLWDTATDQSRELQTTFEQIEDLALTAFQIIVTSRGHQPHCYSLETGSQSELPFAADRLWISEDGNLLAGMQGGRPAPFPGAPPQPGQAQPPDPSQPPAPSQPPGSAAIQLWDSASGTMAAALRSENGPPLAAAFSPDGSLFATAQSDNTIGIWSTVTGALMGRCSGHKQLVRAVAFAHDGKTFATASDDGTLRLWSVSAHQELFAIAHLGEHMNSLLFSPDDSVLIVAVSNAPASLRFHRAPRFEQTDRPVE